MSGTYPSSPGPPDKQEAGAVVVVPSVASLRLHGAEEAVSVMNLKVSLLSDEGPSIRVEMAHDVQGVNRKRIVVPSQDEVQESRQQMV